MNVAHFLKGFFANNEIDIFYVMSHDEIIGKVSSWATAVDIVSIFKKH